MRGARAESRRVALRTSHSCTMSSAPAAATHARSGSATPNVIVLGADTLLAARPATPAQVANACYAAGYSAVIPASWGDELIAAACVRALPGRAEAPVVLCVCPRVAERLRRMAALVPYVLSLAPPPVAAARYVRARAGRFGVHVTYIGECPGAADPAVDRHATPAALFRSLAKRGIDPAAQPPTVDERRFRDGRRFYSVPGGAPAPNWLYAERRGHALLEPTARDDLAEVAHHITLGERRLLDLAPRLGCACSGAIDGESWIDARARVAALEPPRAVHEVLDHDVPVDVSRPLEPWAGSVEAGRAGDHPTGPIALEALAALHDPATRASGVRPAPAGGPPRASAGEATRPPTLPGVPTSPASRRR